MNEETIEDSMTDLQFKSFLKQLARRLEAASAEPNPGKMRARLNDIVRDLRSDVEARSNNYPARHKRSGHVQRERRGRTSEQHDDRVAAARPQRRFLERLLKPGVGDETKASIEQRLKGIVNTLEK